MTLPSTIRRVSTSVPAALKVVSRPLQLRLAVPQPDFTRHLAFGSPAREKRSRWMTARLYLLPPAERVYLFLRLADKVFVEPAKPWFLKATSICGTTAEYVNVKSTRDYACFVAAVPRQTWC